MATGSGIRRHPPDASLEGAAAEHEVPVVVGVRRSKVVGRAKVRCAEDRAAVSPAAAVCAAAVLRNRNVVQPGRTRRSSWVVERRRRRVFDVAGNAQAAAPPLPRRREGPRNTESDVGHGDRQNELDQKEHGDRRLSTSLHRRHTQPDRALSAAANVHRVGRYFSQWTDASPRNRHNNSGSVIMPPPLGMGIKR